MKTILFLGSVQGSELGSAAAAAFNAAAKEARLDSIATAATLATSADVLNADTAQINGADLLIGFSESTQLPLLKTHYSQAVARTEFWRLSSENQDNSALATYIQKLCVRLILKGGKRESAPPELCTRCGKALAFCPCPKQQKSPQPPSKSSAAVRVSIQSKGRGGKKVTVISGLPLEAEEMAALAARLKELLGSGGTVKDGCIEIQGNQREPVIARLQTLGYRAKPSGS